jgi:transposase
VGYFGTTDPARQDRRQATHNGYAGSIERDFLCEQKWWAMANAAHEFPKWQTVYFYYNTWRKGGLWGKWNAILREQVRVEQGRESTPSAAILGGFA